MVLYTNSTHISRYFVTASKNTNDRFCIKNMLCEKKIVLLHRVKILNTLRKNTQPTA